MNQRISKIKLNKRAYSAFKMAFAKAIYHLNSELKNGTGITQRVSVDLLQYDFQVWNYLLEELEKGNNATIWVNRENADGQ